MINEEVKNEVKKTLYKNKPKAIFSHILSGYAHYNTRIDNIDIQFKIPVDDMGEATFMNVMEAQLLNRWIHNVIHITS